MKKIIAIDTGGIHTNKQTNKQIESEAAVFLDPALGWSLNHLRFVSSCLSILPTDGRVGESHFTPLPAYDDGGTRLTNGFIEIWHSLVPE